MRLAAYFLQQLAYVFCRIMAARNRQINVFLCALSTEDTNPEYDSQSKSSIKKIAYATKNAEVLAQVQGAVDFDGRFFILPPVHEEADLLVVVHGVILT